MARARAIPGLNAADPFSVAARKVVAVRAAEVFEHAEGVLDTSDIERVHDMRVATRRLRAVLEIFAPCFPKADLKQALSEIKRLADALGERRDPDVHIAALSAFAEAAGPPDRPGIESLIARFRAQQSEGNQRLQASLREIRRSGLDRRLLALVEEPA